MTRLIPVLAALCFCCCNQKEPLFTLLDANTTNVHFINEVKDTDSLNILDYLYYYTNRFTKNVHEDLLEDLRVDISELSSEEKEKLQKLISKFTSIKIL
jgi:hypothetical protein